MQPTHCDITVGVYCDVIAPLPCTIFHEWGSDTCTWKTTFCTLQIWAKLQVGDIQQWWNLFLKYILYKLTFSILLINASNIRFEARIHQLNENMDSISGFEMFSSLCSDFKVTFLIYLGWIVNSTMSVYLKYNSSKWYPKYIWKIQFQAKFCNLQMHVNATSTLKIQSKYQCKMQYFTIKYMHCHLNKSYFLTSLKYFNLD